MADITVSLPKFVSAMSGSRYGRACGHVLARAHARRGDRVAIASYLGKGDALVEALTWFAEAYAYQNERDYAVLCEAVAGHRVAVHIEK